MVEHKTSEPNLADYIEKWSKKYLAPSAQEMGAREEYTADLARYLRGEIKRLESQQAMRPASTSSKTSLDRCLKFLRGFGGAHEDWVVEIEALQRNLALRNEQIDGYERQLGIDQAGAERTIGSELERLRNVTDVLKTVYRLAAGHATECQCRQCEIFELLEPIVGNTSPRSAHETDRDGSAKCPHCRTWRTAEEIGKGMCCDKDVPPEEPRETSREVEPDLYRDLQRALSDLSMVMGNPCVEIPDNGHLETALIDEATRRLRPEEPTELPEALRDPVKNLERGRELLKAWGRTPVTDAALAESKESPLARAVRIARGDTGPPTELVRFAEKASGHPVGIDTSSVSESEKL